METEKQLGPWSSVVVMAIVYLLHWFGCVFLSVVKLGTIKFRILNQIWHYVAAGLRLRSPPARRSEGIATGGPHHFLDKG